MTDLIAAAARLIMAPGHVYELRVPKFGGRKRVRSGYFNTPEALARAAAGLDGQAAGVYITLNPVNPALMARAENSMVDYAENLTSDDDIVRRHWILIDLDPQRPTGISATDDEKLQAWTVAKAVEAWLAGHGWPAPVWGDSGNGWHLLYRIDEPNNSTVKDQIQAILAAAQAACGTSAVKVDQTVFNASRISKLYGTLSAKGQDTIARPHRVSAVDFVPLEILTVSSEALAAVAALAPQPDAKSRAAPPLAATGGRPVAMAGTFDVEAFIQRTGLQVVKESPWKGSGHKWVMDVCAWNDSHVDNSFWIGRMPSGAIAAGCSHDSCAGNDWQALRALLEPPAERPALAVVPEPEPEQSRYIADPSALTPRTGRPIPCGLKEMRVTYVLLVGSTDVWDLRTWEQKPLTTVKAAHAADFTAWQKDERLLRVDLKAVVFEPAGAAPGQLNIYQGLTMQPDPEMPCELMVAHLAWLCSGDPVVTHWLTAWLAYPLQFPGAKLHTAVVMHGPQGAGKNMLFESVSRIYGDYSAEISQVQIESTYTGWQSGKLFCLADEVISKADLRTLKNRIKALITSPNLMIEDKFKTARKEANHLNTVFLSNEDMPVDAEKDDRRFAVIKTPGPQSSAYYKALAAETAAGGDAGFMAYLMAYDLQGWNPHEKPPETVAKAELQRLCRGSAETFLDEWAEDLAGDEFTFGCCSVLDLYAAYKLWTEQRGEKWGVDRQVAFAIKVSKRWKTQQARVEGFGRATFITNGHGMIDAQQADRFRAGLEVVAKRLKALRP